MKSIKQAWAAAWAAEVTCRAIACGAEMRVVHLSVQFGYCVLAGHSCVSRVCWNGVAAGDVGVVRS